MIEAVVGYGKMETRADRYFVSSGATKSVDSASLVQVDESQAWFWTEKWQAAETAIQADFDAGRVHRFANVEDAIAALGLEEDAGN